MEHLPHIALVGPTGAGKTSFLNRCAGEERGRVGHDLDSCTETVQPYQCFLDGKSIAIVDTPGFDDNSQSDFEILCKLAAYLKETYEIQKKLTALFYFIDITETKMKRSALTNLEMFQDLCGEDCLENVVFVTTKWDLTKNSVTDKQRAEANEKQLEEKFLRKMRGSGAQLQRHDNSRVSAESLLRLVQNFASTTTRIQYEMVDEKKDLKDTTAGRAVDEKMSKKIKELEAELEKMKKLMEHNVKLEEIVKGYEEKIENLNRDREKMEQHSKSASAARWRDFLMEIMKIGIQEGLPHVIRSVESKLRTSPGETSTNYAETRTSDDNKNSDRPQYAQTSFEDRKKGFNMFTALASMIKLVLKH